MDYALSSELRWIEDTYDNLVAYFTNASDPITGTAMADTIMKTLDTNELTVLLSALTPRCDCFEGEA